MEQAFVIVVAAVGVAGVLGAVLALLGSRDAWRALGRDGLVKESDRRETRGREEESDRRETRGREEELDRREPRGREEESDRREPRGREEEIRQMLEARNRRRRRRGERELDLPAELERLTRTPPADPPAPRAGDELDPELLAEIREFVLARNHRRTRRGLPPLDVETEIARQIAQLNG